MSYPLNVPLCNTYIYHLYIGSMGSRLLSLISFSQILFFLFVCLLSFFLSPSLPPSSTLSQVKTSEYFYSFVFWWLPTFFLAPLLNYFFRLSILCSFCGFFKNKKWHNRFCVFSTIASNNYLHMQREINTKEQYFDIFFNVCQAFSSH